MYIFHKRRDMGCIVNERGISMQDDTVLEKFKKFKDMVVSTNIPNSVLLEMIENFITADEDYDTAAENIPILDGQLSLFDYGLCA